MTISTFDNISLTNCTLLISGPLISRIEERTLIESFVLLDKMQSQFGITVMISTYLAELTPAIQKFNFQFIIVDDPGQDVFYTGFTRKNSKPNQIRRNTSRMLNSTTLGLLKIETDFVIKTRIEILPASIDFVKTVFRSINDFPETQLIVFIAEHFTGLKYTEKLPVLLFVPDTFQIMRTVDCLKLWQGASKLWQNHKNDLMNRNFRIGVANEQILGIALVNCFLTPIKFDKLKKFHRYSLNFQILKAQLTFEYFLFKSYLYDDFFLQEGRYRWDMKPTPTIKLPLSQNKIDKIFTLLMFIARRQSHQIKFYLEMSRKLLNKLISKIIRT